MRASSFCIREWRMDSAQINGIPKRRRRTSRRGHNHIQLQQQNI